MRFFPQGKPKPINNIHQLSNEYTKKKKEKRKKLKFLLFQLLFFLLCAQESEENMTDLSPQLKGTQSRKNQNRFTQQNYDQNKGIYTESKFGIRLEKRGVG